jgi:hypothetical protein
MLNGLTSVQRVANKVCKMYIIQRQDGAFVTRTGSFHSYTWDLQKAQTFPSVQAATSYGVCENEQILPVSSLFNR